jgi:DNA-binding NtrC family response regulator
MKRFTILMYEDDVQYKESFEYNLSAKFQLKNHELVLHHRINGDSIEQDLNAIDPNVILIDHDLGALTGDELIQVLDDMPDHTNVILLYYSGGESLDDLLATVKKYKCHIQCFTKEGEELENAILKLLK